MQAYEIIRVTPALYAQCNTIWDMAKQPRTQRWLEEIKAGTRLTYAYAEDGIFLGEGSLVLANNDPDYTIEGKRVYLSRLIVKKEFRNRGIGKLLVDFLCETAKRMGYAEISIGVDKSNAAALHLYRSKGFDRILFDGEDEYGPYYKLLKELE